MNILWLLILAQEPGREAFDALGKIILAEANVRANDTDGDGRMEFWVRDLAGLGRALAPAQNLKELQTFVQRLAATEGAAPQPLGGYVFRAVPKVGDVLLDQREGWNPSNFAFVALPASYPKDGRLSFLVNADNARYAKDTGGALPASVPLDPGKDGWLKVGAWPPPPVPAIAAPVAARELDALGGPPAAMKFSADGLRLFVALAEKPAVQVYDELRKGPIWNAAAPAEPVASMDVAGDRVAIGDWKGQVRLVGPDGAARAWAVSEHKVEALAFTPAGLLTFCMNTRRQFDPGQVKLWDVDTLKERRAFPDSDFCAVPADGRFAVTREAAAFLRWDVAAGTSTKTPHPPNMDLRGRWVSTSAGDAFFGWLRGGGVGFLRPGQKELFVPVKGTGSIFALDPAGRVAATGGEDGAVWLWAPDGKPLRSLGAHAKPVRALAFSPDGRRLASASLDGAVRVWPLP